jgi:lysophospholipase L1-like esterase
MTRVASPSWTATFFAAAAILVALIAAAAAAAAPAGSAAAPFSYVALGDSYSSGEGVRPFIDDGCHRSSRAYPTWVKRPGAAKTLYATASSGGQTGSVRKAAGVAWAFWACSGAKTTNVLPESLGGVPQRRAGQAVPGRKTQLDSADLTRADLVTLTIGGNDAGFVEVLVLCAVSNCNTQVFEQGRRAIIDGTRPALEKVYRATAARAPRARILVLGYPELIPASRAEQSCAALSAFRGEGQMMRRLGTHLNDTIEAAVETVAKTGAKIEFVPAEARFAGHEICGRKGPWLNAFVASPIGLGVDPASFHPNLAGQRDGYGVAANAALSRGR